MRWHFSAKSNLMKEEKQRYMALLFTLLYIIYIRSIYICVVVFYPQVVVDKYPQSTY